MLNDCFGMFVRECQLFVGRVQLTHADESHRQVLQAFVARLPSLPRPVEQMVAGVVLFHLAVQWSRWIHRQFHDDDISVCTFDCDTDLVRFWTGSHPSPVVMFEQWGAAFLGTIERWHVPSVSHRVRQIIDKECDRRLAVGQLARHVGCHPARLRALFKRDCGMSIREYQTRRQLLRAAHMLVGSDMKVDAVARMAGFSSRKSFYEAFRRTLQMHPSDLRHWSNRDLEAVEAQLLP
jgi:AraC-like DNA-binding protein